MQGSTFGYFGVGLLIEFELDPTYGEKLYMFLVSFDYDNYYSDDGFILDQKI